MSFGKRVKPVRCWPSTLAPIVLAPHVRVKKKYSRQLATTQLADKAHHGKERKQEEPLAELLDTVSAESFETALSRVQSIFKPTCKSEYRSPKSLQVENRKLQQA